MALISAKSVHRLDHPTEEGAWFDVRPVTAGDLELLTAEGNAIKLSFDALAAVMIAWSYEELPSVETVRRLDLDTYLWLNEQLLTLSNVRSDSEKKDSEDASSPVSLLEPEASLANSPIWRN